MYDLKALARNGAYRDFCIYHYGDDSLAEELQRLIETDNMDFEMLEDFFWQDYEGSSVTGQAAEWRAQRLTDKVLSEIL